MKKKSAAILTTFLSIILILSLGINASLFIVHKNQNDALTGRIEKLEQLLPNSAAKENMGATQKTYIEESAIIDTVQKIKPSVVSIIETKNLPVFRRQNLFFSDPFFRDLFPELNPGNNTRPTPNNDDETRRVQTGGGSGFIYSEEGFVMTNRHVVADEDAEYTVILYDGTELKAEVLARDTVQDVAVVKIQPPEDGVMPELKSVTFGDSENIQVGQRVVAIGNALAEFQNTVTTGIISALGRNIVASGRDGDGERLQGLLQTDAAINPGNSGGPLVNLQGQVVGMNTAVASGAQGIGFAIPVNDLKSIAQSVEEHGKIVRPFLGVRYVMLTEEMAQELKLEVSEGALLIGDARSHSFAVVKDSPADQAGLKEGDVVLEVDDEKVTPENDLQTIISAKKPGETVRLKIWRDGKEQEVKVELREME